MKKMHLKMWKLTLQIKSGVILTLFIRLNVMATQILSFSISDEASETRNNVFKT